MKLLIISLLGLGVLVGGYFEYEWRTNIAYSCYIGKQATGYLVEPVYKVGNRTFTRAEVLDYLIAKTLQQ